MEAMGSQHVELPVRVHKMQGWKEILPVRLISGLFFYT